MTPSAAALERAFPVRTADSDPPPIVDAFDRDPARADEQARVRGAVLDAVNIARRDGDDVFTIFHNRSVRAELARCIPAGLAPPRTLAWAIEQADYDAEQNQS